MKKLQLTPFPADLKVKFTDKLPDGALGMTSMDNSTILVQLTVQMQQDEALFVCVHEAVHAVQFLAEWLDTDFDDETEAYLVQYISKFLLGCIQKVLE